MIVDSGDIRSDRSWRAFHKGILVWGGVRLIFSHKDKSF